MGVYVLKLTASLEGVTNLKPLDTPENPFEYTFQIECTACREVHPKPVTINCFESHDLNDSKGAASFEFKCRNCTKTHSATISRTKVAYTADDAEAKRAVAILNLDTRGMEFKTFIPEGHFECVGVSSGTRFDDVDLEEGEWYDYDDKASAEVSVVDAKWEITRN